MDNKNNIMIALATVFLLVVGVGLLAASSFASNSNQGAAPTPTPTYNNSINNGTITVKQGDVFNVTLAENPSTGYTWNMTETAGLTIVDLGFVPSQSGMMGASGTHVWQITATGAGDQQLSGIYKRSWEPASGNVTTYTLNVKIV